MQRAFALALLVAAFAAPAAGAKTLRVNWSEQRRMHDGTFAFHVSRIDATTRSWSAVVAITNHTTTTYGVDSGCEGWSPQFVTPGGDDPSRRTEVRVVERLGRSHRALVVAAGPAL